MFAVRNLPGAIFNDTHWSDPTSLALYKEGLAETDPAKRNEKFAAVMKILYNSGGDIITQLAELAAALAKIKAAAPKP